MGSEKLKFLSWLILVLLTQVLTGSDALAGFHDRGVAGCSSCHIMHQGEVGGGGGGGGGPGQAGGAALLIDGPASDLCLNCHATGLGSVMAADPLNPSPERGPGNFGFLLANNINDGPDGITNPISGDHAGHNIRAPGHGLSTDGTYQNSPGGSFPATRLGCTSCHDPHGNTNYRMLRGGGMGSMGVFSSPPPDAAGLPLEFADVEANDSHISYISGMSQWCANCHQDYLTFDHQVTGTSFEHPVDETFEGSVLSWYNGYNGTADPTGGDPSLAYLAAVPFEDSSNTVFRTAGPTATSRLMCLTCHRAHASSAPAAGRWDFNVETLGQDGLVSGSYAIPNPYPDPNQQSLCYKCHETGSD